MGDRYYLGVGVQISFLKEPTLTTIKEARRVLDDLTDKLIKEALDVNSSIDSSKR